MKFSRMITCSGYKQGHSHCTIVREEFIWLAVAYPPLFCCRIVLKDDCKPVSVSASDMPETALRPAPAKRDTSSSSLISKISFRNFALFLGLFFDGMTRFTATRVVLYVAATTRPNVPRPSTSGGASNWRFLSWISQMESAISISNTLATH